MKIGAYDALYQAWIWDGISAKSIIFLKNDIENLDEKEIIKLVKDSKFYNTGKVTYSKGDEFIFVNFHFES